MNRTVDGLDARWCDAVETCTGVTEWDRVGGGEWHSFPAFTVKYHPQCCPRRLFDQTCSLDHSASPQDETDGTPELVTTPRWAWWAMVLVITLLGVGLWMLTQSRLTAAIVCGIFGLVIGCATHTILGYRENR